MNDRKGMECFDFIWGNPGRFCTYERNVELDLNNLITMVVTTKLAYEASSPFYVCYLLR